MIKNGLAAYRRTPLRPPSSAARTRRGRRVERLSDRLLENIGRHFFWPGLGLAVLIAGFLLAGCSSGGGGGGEDFDLKGLDGETIRLSDYRGQVVLLNFWASWCPPCRVEMPDLNALHAAHAGEGLVVLAINVGETQAEASAFIRAGGFSLPVALDPDKAVANKLGVRNLPTSIVIDQQGNMVQRWAGTLTLEAAEALVLPLLAGEGGTD